jgi:hypothetical protein
MGWTGKVDRMGDKKKIYMVLIGNPERMRPRGKPRHISEDNIKIDLREKGWGDLDWTHLAQDRGQCWAFVNAVINFRV